MSLLKSITSPWRGEERRREVRQPQDCAVALFRQGRRAGMARLLDLSPGGARLHGEADAIQAADAFVLTATRTAYFYEPVRSGFGGVGVRITRTHTLSGRLNPHLEPMRRALG